MSNNNEAEHDAGAARNATIEAATKLATESRNDIGASVPDEAIMRFFAWKHLPIDLQRVSAPFGELAELLVRTLPRNPERLVALRKLLEGKDAAVRAALP